MDRSYESLGVGYSAVRAEDPRIAARVRDGLGDARTVVNVGAGTGNYEPPDLEVTAVEPSTRMRAQRSADAAPVIDGHAEDLPFADDAFDAAMAVLSDHHWSDRRAGLAEMRRVARDRVVIFTFDAHRLATSWIVAEYFPTFAARDPDTWSIQDARYALGGRVDVLPVPIPRDCRDGFLHAYWRRPEAYLDPGVRAGISLFHLLPPEEVQAGVTQLQRDLDDGTWARRHAELLELDELDLGYVLLVGTPWVL